MRIFSTAVLLAALPACKTVDNATQATAGTEQGIREIRADITAMQGALEGMVAASGQDATAADEAGAALSTLGPAAGDLPAPGGSPMSGAQAIDVDGDGDTDDVTAVDDGTVMLWLWPVDGADESVCESDASYNFVVTDNPPTRAVSAGQWDAECGAFACPLAEGFDAALCRCVDGASHPIDGSGLGAEPAPHEGEGEPADGCDSEAAEDCIVLNCEALDDEAEYEDCQNQCWIAAGCG
jgi:hypothetical protein